MLVAVSPRPVKRLKVRLSSRRQSSIQAADPSVDKKLDAADHTLDLPVLPMTRLNMEVV